MPAAVGTGATGPVIGPCYSAKVLPGAARKVDPEDPRMGVTRRNVVVAMGFVGGVTMAALSVPPVRRLFHPLVVRVRGSYTVEQRVAQFSAARARLEEH